MEKEKKKKEIKYPDTIQVRVNEEITEILKNQENNSDFIRQLILNDNSKCQDTLDFLKSLFELGKVTINRKNITDEELKKLNEI